MTYLVLSVKVVINRFCFDPGAVACSGQSGKSLNQSEPISGKKNYLNIIVITYSYKY